MLQYSHFEDAKEIMDSINSGDDLSADQRSELLWFKSSYYFHNAIYGKALDSVNTILQHDPWNISYLVQQAMVLSKYTKIKSHSHCLIQY